MLKTLQNWKIEESNDNWNLADETILNEVEFDLLRKMMRDIYPFPFPI